MAKRFTDTQKWKNPWFRALPLKAKLVWIYLCDDCDCAGVMKLDYKLASFQVGFDFTLTNLTEWFGPKICVFDDKILLVPFFGFQYGESKDTWSAKVRAKAKLEALGFSVLNNEAVIPKDPTVGAQSGHSVPTCLSISISKGIGISISSDDSVKRKKITTPEQLLEELGTENLNALLKIYPQEVMDREFPRMALWLANNRPKKNYASFVDNWLKKEMKEQDAALKASNAKLNVMGLMP